MASKEVVMISAHHHKVDTVSDEAFEKWVHETAMPQWITLVKNTKYFVVRWCVRGTRMNKVFGRCCMLTPQY
jgi:hypothetical protein